MSITEENYKRTQEYNNTRVNKHDRIYPGALTVEDVVKSLTRPITNHQTMIGNQIMQSVVVGTETPNFHYVSFNELEMHVGYVGPYKVIIDENLEHQNMSPTAEFKRIQTHKLWHETNQWMRKRFGVEYPIQRLGDTLIMHPKALDSLHHALGGRG